MRVFTKEAWAFGPHSRLVVLTGAGISAESGIATFRDSGGLWENHRIEDVATPEGFARNPQAVIDFYNQRREQLLQVEPNAAHLALARLQRLLPDRMLLVTQNVDDLHERSGSAQVLHMHGELKKLRCLRHTDHILSTTLQQDPHTHCPQCGGAVRPHIVWFGEIPLQMDVIEKALQQCTHFVYIGTSSQVYPAAGFKSAAKAAGAKVLCINLETEADAVTDFYLQGKAGIRVPEWVAATLD